MEHRTKGHNWAQVLWTLLGAPVTPIDPAKAQVERDTFWTEKEAES